MWVVTLLACNRCEDVCTAWLLNESGETSPRLSHPVDVTAVTEVDVDGVGYVLITTEGIPSYETTLSQADIDELNARPNASDDFKNGSTTASAGQEALFGDDLGFESTTDDTACAPGAGYGFWPPGPGCPDAQGRSWYVPRSPIRATDEVCTTSLGPAGLWVNGVSLYAWADGNAFDEQGVWQNIAPLLERWDQDVCGGHVAGTDYHHHAEPVCLGEQLGDAGDDHSPIYGFAADGYPVYGPWTADGERAESCWVARDYDDPEDPLGCGGVGERRCLLVDPMDPSAGTEATAFPGPRTDDEVLSPSGSPFSAADPLYVQDYWYDAACTDAGGLDEHNGHDHSGLGFHYHVTDGFPFTVGPTLYGRVRDETAADCSG